MKFAFVWLLCCFAILVPDDLVWPGKDETLRCMLAEWGCDLKNWTKAGVPKMLDDHSGQICLLIPAVGSEIFSCGPTFQGLTDQCLVLGFGKIVFLQPLLLRRVSDCSHVSLSYLCSLYSRCSFDDTCCS